MVNYHSFVKIERMHPKQEEKFKQEINVKAGRCYYGYAPRNLFVKKFCVIEQKDINEIENSIVFEKE